MTVTKNPEVEVFERARPGKRRRYTAAQKRALLDEAALPGQSISLVSRRYGVAASLLFRWKQIESAGGAVALAADDDVVAAAEMKSLKAQVRELERQLGRKTMENEILKEGIEIAKKKGWLLQSPSHSKAGSQ
jgi:transposase